VASEIRRRKARKQENGDELGKGIQTERKEKGKGRERLKVLEENAEEMDFG
jgi:hypothetical protein